MGLYNETDYSWMNTEQTAPKPATPAPEDAAAAKAAGAKEGADARERIMARAMAAAADVFVRDEDGAVRLIMKADEHIGNCPEEYTHKNGLYHVFRSAWCCETNKLIARTPGADVIAAMRAAYVAKHGTPKTVPASFSRGRGRGRGF
jgi:hypothetical protein